MNSPLSSRSNDSYPSKHIMFPLFPSFPACVLFGVVCICRCVCVVCVVRRCVKLDRESWKRTIEFILHPQQPGVCYCSVVFNPIHPPWSNPNLLLSLSLIAHDP
uniref:Uncharacterized protein n=1 Tax=Anopheles aquasalis TaxID=42839 RepID=T1DQM7_ANOAQ